MSADSRIDEFWRWFSALEHQIKAAMLSEDYHWLREHLSPQVRVLRESSNPPNLNWEIGPGVARPWQFTLSPTVIENLPIVERAVAHAPELPDWEWYSCKPAKLQNEYSIALDRPDGTSIDIDASNWTYILRHINPQKKLGILFIAPSLPSLCTDDEIRFAYLLLDNILGERLVIENFQEARLIESSTPIVRNSVLPITTLREEALRILDKH